MRRLDDLLKPEFAVVTATQEAMSWISKAVNLRWRELGGARVVIADTGASTTRDGIAIFVESDGLFSSWMRENCVSAIIVRPDRYLFAGANAAELNMLIENLTEALHVRS